MRPVLPCRNFPDARPHRGSVPQDLRRELELAGLDRQFDAAAFHRHGAAQCLYPVDALHQEILEFLAFAGARRRYGDITPRVRSQLEHELALIAELAYEPYFLTVHDIVRHARSLGILCQGRGSAANSAVCFCLGITEVDPARMSLLMERFISRERNEPPDIDVDFEHERREEVMQYIYRRYGRERAGIAATVIHYRSRSTVREVGKALGLSLDAVDRFAKVLDAYAEAGNIPERIHEAGLDPNSLGAVQLVQLSTELLGFPRHLSQHVGGFVISRGPLAELVPIENAAMPERTVIQWDKDDLEALGLLKVDVLALGMLSAIRRALNFINLKIHEIPPEDPAVYEMIQKADTIGVFQIESRAQMSMLPRLRPKSFYDLVIEVAIVRPGPIQGGMVHPYLRRRQGLEPVTYQSEEVRKLYADLVKRKPDDETLRREYADLLSGTTKQRSQAIEEYRKLVASDPSPETRHKFAKLLADERSRLDQALAEARLAAPQTPEMVDVALKNKHTTARLAWEPRLHDPHLPKWLHRIDVPTHIVWGREDKLVPVAYAQAFAKLIPGARVTIIPDCGHLPHVEKADDYARIAAAFCQERRP